MIDTQLFRDCDPLTIWLADGRVLHGYYTCCRVSQLMLSEGYHKYDIRESADLNGDMVELKELVIVNHHGTFITMEQVDCQDGLEIAEWDFSEWE